MSAVAENSPESPSQSPPPANAAIASPSASASATADGENNTPSAPFALPPGMPMPASLAGMQFVPYFPPMASSGDPADPNAQPQPQMMIHPAFLSQIQMYPYPYPGMLAHGLKLKRKQVKNACTNCQKACKKCDDERPCPRCVKYGIAEECQDSIRKERRKGIKRGSYKKKSTDGGEEEGSQPAFMSSYPAQLYSQWAAAAMSAAGATGGKPGESSGGAPGYYPYFLAPVPQGEAGASGEGTPAPNTPAYFQQMYYGAGYPGGYPMPGYSPDATASGSAASTSKRAAKQEEESEDELENELEAEEEEEMSPKRKPKKKRRSD